MATIKKAQGGFNAKFREGIKSAVSYSKKMKPYYENLINKKAKEAEEDRNLKSNPWGGGKKGEKGTTVKKAQKGTKVPAGFKKPSSSDSTSMKKTYPGVKKDSSSAKKDTVMSPAMNAYYQELIKKKAKEVEEDRNLKSNPWGGGKKGKKGIKVGKANAGVKIKPKAKYGAKKKK